MPYGVRWDECWRLLALSPPHTRVDRPRKALRDRALVQRGDPFRLGRGEWDIGTMFSLAESITAHADEFRGALVSFLGALRPSAPFAAALMGDSSGYTVANCYFPAVAVSEGDVESCLAALGADVKSLTSHRSRRSGRVTMA